MFCGNGEESVSSPGMVDYRGWVVALKPDIRTRQLLPRCQPRRVDMPSGKPCQFWNVATNVVAFGVELLALSDRIEDSKVGLSIAATTARPLPPEIVLGSVAVY